jgi:ribosome-associated protein
LPSSCPLSGREFLVVPINFKADQDRAPINEDMQSKMSTATWTAATGASLPDPSSQQIAPDRLGSDELLSLILSWLDEAKAENVVAIALAGKSTMADHMVIASGLSDRHVGAMADQIARQMKDAGYGGPRVEGKQQCDWVLIDAGDIIIHLFRPEVREFYNLEKMWSAPRVGEPPAH